MISRTFSGVALVATAAVMALPAHAGPRADANWRALPVANSISYVTSGTPTPMREVLIVEDPQCPGCRMLHESLKKVPNLRVRILIAPALGQKSAEMATQIYCSRDPVRQWKSAMETGRVTGPSCAEGRQKAIANLKWFAQYGGKGTPTAFYRNGHASVGAGSAAWIESVLSKPPL